MYADFEAINDKNIIEEHTIIMTEQDKIDFTNVKFCHICNVKYKPKVKEQIVKDHESYTGVYKGIKHVIQNSIMKSL